MKDLEIQWLRDGLISERSAALPRPDCPEPDRIWAAAQGELPRPELEPVVDHVAECAVCMEAWKLALAVEEDAGTSGGQSRLRRAVPMISIAAGLLLALGLQFFVAPDQGVELEGMREGTFPDRVLELSGSHQLPRDHFFIDWSGPEGATYGLRLRNQDGDSLLEVEGLQDSAFLASPKALESLETGDELLCTIEVFPPTGKPLRKTFSLEILSPAR